MQQNLTQGSITRHLLSMAAFIGLGLLFQTLYFLVDLFFVSRLGTAAIAGVSSAGTVLFLVMGFTQLITVGGMALVAQALGARDTAGANLLNNQTFSLALAMAAMTAVLIALLGDRAVAAVSADAATAEAARAYLHAFAPGLALMFPGAAIGASLRGAGVVGPPMMVQSGTLILNAALAPVLIAGWFTDAPLGVAGAGWASTIAATVGLLALLAIFPRVQTVMRISARELAPRLPAWGRITFVGLPAAGQFVLMFVVAAVVYWVIRDFGEHAQAGFGVGVRVMQSLFLPVMAVAFAAAPIAGQNYGARNAARVRETFRHSAIICAALMAVMTLVVQWRGELLVRPFTDDHDALAVASDYLRIASWNFVATGIVFTCSSLFQGLGDTRPALLAGASRLLTFVAPAIWLVGQPVVTLTRVWYLSVGSVLIQMMLSLWLLRRQYREKLDPLEPADTGFVPEAAAPSPP